MLKPFLERVKSTYDLMLTIIQQASLNANLLLAKRKAAIESTIRQQKFPLGWQVDTTRFTDIFFKGFYAGYRKSNATEQPILFYDHNLPYTKKVKFFDVYLPINIIQTPRAYVISQGWWTVIDLLKLNHVLQEKEGYSDYRWDEIAAKVLKEEPALKKKIDQKKEADTLFAKNAAAQLNFIYKNSKYYEPEYFRYPVYRLENK